jgi:hypothetical protein
MGATKVVVVIAGTVAGVGAVMAYAPPHQGSSNGGITPNPSTSASASASASASTSEMPTPSQSATPTSTPTATSTQVPTKSPVPTKTPAPKPTPKATATKAPIDTRTRINGTFTGVEVQAGSYGPVQVQIDIVKGKIVAARALKLPTATDKDKELNLRVVPYLIQETIKASSADIQGVGGATFTSQGWYDSLVSALAAAGL